MSIYIVTHKAVNHNFPKNYKTMVVDANHNRVEGDFFDNTGINISNKNFSYCELTAVYWLWKNSDDNLVGIDHYRRFFCDERNKLISIEQAEEILKASDMILPPKVRFRRRMDIRFWTTSGYKKDLKIIENAIMKLSPDYIADYKRFMRGYHMHCYNMFIANKQIFNSYCNWLFPLLEEIEKSILAEERHGYYRRVFGFIAERLLNIYVIHNNFRVYEMNVLFTGEKQTIAQRVQARMRKLRDKYRGLLK